MMLVRDVDRLDHAHRLRRLVLDVLEQRDRHLGRKRHVELAGNKAENGRRAVGDDGEFDAVEMRQALLPVVRIAGDLDGFVGLELDELERAGADRLGAHVAGRDVAGIDRRIAGGEQRQQRRLRPLQVERGLEVAVDSDVDDLVVPGLARVLAEFLLRLAHQHVEGAFDVGRRERLAVVPLDALAKLEAELLLVIAPGPALGEIRDDRLHGVLRHVLLVDDEVVEDRHEGNVDRIGRLLMDRGAGRTVAVIDLQDAALSWVRQPAQPRWTPPTKTTPRPQARARSACSPPSIIRPHRADCLGG